MTTGGFTSEGLLREEQLLALAQLEQVDALEIGEIAVALAKAEPLAISIEVQLVSESSSQPWTVFHYALPGALPDQPSWIARKANVVRATGHSTMYERVLAEERGIDWYQEHALPEETHAIHGGGLPLNVAGSGLQGILLISGLPQVEDHLFGIRVITQFLARQGELL
jgi:uncharacterized protein (UPF0303 family)